MATLSDVAVERIELHVIGIPAPQGSKVRFPNGAMVDGTSKVGRAKLAEWRRAVADAARAHLADHPRSPIDEPVRVTILFRFSLPASDAYRLLHSVMPDIDKTTRATLDALKHGGLLRDDSLVCDLKVSKRYAQPGQQPGASIAVELLGPVEAEHRARRKQEVAEARLAARRTPAVPEGQEALL